MLLTDKEAYISYLKRNQFSDVEQIVDLFLVEILLNGLEQYLSIEAALWNFAYHHNYKTEYDKSVRFMYMIDNRVL